MRGRQVVGLAGCCASAGVLHNCVQLDLAAVLLNHMLLMQAPLLLPATCSGQFASRMAEGRS
jgi:hypothetical protein